MALEMNPEKVAEVQEVFSMFDKDGDGCVTSRELGPILRSIGFNPAESEVEELLKEFDEDGSGNLDFSEFVTLLSRVRRSGDTEAEVDEAFRVFDKEGHGLISAPELRHIMTNLGEKLTEEEVEEMLAFADPDTETGEINYKDLIQMLLQI